MTAVIKAGVSPTVPASSQRILIVPPRKFGLPDLRELWRYRAVLVALAHRDFQVRYKQTALGAAWVVLQPITMAFLFAFTLGQVDKLRPPSGVSYVLFTLTALVIWQFFAHALSHTSNSLLMNENLVTKIFFPRLLIPLASIVAGMVDLGVSVVLLAVGLVIFRVPITISILTLPLFFLLAVAFATGVGVLLAAINVRYRDVRHMLPFLSTALFFATPIAYPASLVPERFRILQALNPMVTVVEGFRYSLLQQPSPSLPTLVLGSIVSLSFLLAGLVYFRRVETHFADHI